MSCNEIKYNLTLVEKCNKVKANPQPTVHIAIIKPERRKERNNKEHSNKKHQKKSLCKNNK